MDTERFKTLLSTHHQWPELYAFKFVVPTTELPALCAFFPAIAPTLRPSANGKYTSATFAMQMLDAESVLAVYESVAGIPGLLAL